MSDENLSTENVDGKKILNLDSLLTEKMPIMTSVGMLYVRYSCLGDWKCFDLEDDVELGRVAIQRLCGRIEDKRDRGGLSDDDMRLLNDADFQALTLAIAKQNGWPELPSKSGLKDLGECIKAEQSSMIERHEKMLGNLRKSIGSSYSFLDTGVLERLQKQMAGIASIHSSLAATESIQAALREATLPIASLKKSFSDISTINQALGNSNSKKIADHLKLPGPDSLYKPVMPPKFEETPMGRATLESVENSRQVAEKLDNFEVMFAGLNQTLIQDVLPAWFNKIEEDRIASKSVFKQTAYGLFVTVITSLIVTIAGTWWQISVTKSIDFESSEQQRRAENILKEQLLVQHKQIEQQTKDAAAMRALIESLKQPIPIANNRE
jgi:hypothetical protein